MTVFILLFLLEYLVGSLMFSYWFGKLFGKDITGIRDGNPGAYNLIKSVGFIKGLPGLALDYLKGFIPLYFVVTSAKQLNLSQIELGLICSAPILGHAFSPFMKFKGGKALAVTFGVWSALTKWEVPVMLGILFTSFLIYKPRSIDVEKWQSLAPLSGFTAILLYLIFTNKNTVFWVVWVVNLIVVSLKFYFPKNLIRNT